MNSDGDKRDANPMYLTKDKQKKYRRTTEDKAEYVCIPISEYNGLRNMIRIIRDRSVHSIERGKADEHGYTLKTAEKRNYEQSSNEAFFITKSTPYSVKLLPAEALFLIKKDLSDFYRYVGCPILGIGEEQIAIGRREILIASNQYHDSMWLHEYLLSDSNWGRELYELFRHNEGAFGFEISRLSTNYAAGVFEISYWATGIV